MIPYRYGLGSRPVAGRLAVDRPRVPAATDPEADPGLLARGEALRVHDGEDWIRRLVDPPIRPSLTRVQRAELRALIEPRWRGGAACASADPEAWFPGVGDEPVAAVNATCVACPVARSCLATALLWGEDGIWAATNPYDRRGAYRLLRQWRLRDRGGRGDAGAAPGAPRPRQARRLRQGRRRMTTPTTPATATAGTVAGAGAGGTVPPPVVTAEVIRGYAEEHGVCVRPVLRRVTDRATGTRTTVPIPCGSTRDYRCPPCAAKARRLRAQQCREGWHLTDDPLHHDPDDRDGKDGEQLGDPDVQLEPDDQADSEEQDGTGGGRRVRSTRRRSDAVELPRVPVEDRTVGRTFTTGDGKTYRPSMFVTLTLGSYGKVIPAGRDGKPKPGAGTPVDPEAYDYRRAAVEALFFPRLFDRWVQNLRRCAGFRVQYFGAIEAQRRLAPHIHVAIRGAVPRAVLRQVTKATYLQLWWPRFDHPVYDPETTGLPWWDVTAECYRSPDTGEALPTWEQALDALDRDPDAEPAVVMRFGSQVDIQGIIAPSAEADRAVRYLVKYLTKDIAETYTSDHGDTTDRAYERHITRLWHELLVLPCAPECSNWLRYGIQPKSAGPGLDHGACPSKAHTRECLGLGGRRVQVSRHWSGKTLARASRGPGHRRPGDPGSRRGRGAGGGPDGRQRPGRGWEAAVRVGRRPGGRAGLRERDPRERGAGAAVAGRVRPRQAAR